MSSKGVILENTKSTGLAPLEVLINPLRRQYRLVAEAISDFPQISVVGEHPVCYAVPEGVWVGFLRLGGLAVRPPGRNVAFNR